MQFCFYSPICLLVVHWDNFTFTFAFFFFSVTRQGCIFPGAAVVNKIINYLPELIGFSFKDGGTLDDLRRTKEMGSEGHPRK